MVSKKLEFNGRLLGIRDVPQELVGLVRTQDLAVSFMLQLPSNSLFNHHHFACYHLGLVYHHHHLVISQASDSDASAEDLYHRQRQRQRHLHWQLEFEVQI
jgi:hypothetical protein